MSVLIKDMEMPKNCGECHFCHTENFHQWCCLTEETISAIDAKHFMCPLTQLEPCEDTISRQAAIDCVTYDVEHTIECLKALPSAQPERKRGEWKPIGWSGRIHKCNQCGNMLDFGGVNAGRGDANFCPNCGADMRGEGEG